MNARNADSDVILAFRLGWSLGEFMGHARKAWIEETSRRQRRRQPPKELDGFEAEEAPRLTYSNRYFSRQGAWWQSALRIVNLAQGLGLMEEKDALSEQVRALPGQVHALCFEEGSTPADEWPTPRDFYDTLDRWSREAVIKLVAHSDDAAQAFRAGGQIADTRWYMRPRAAYGEPRHKKQDSWHQLLNHKRLSKLIDQIRSFEAHLPARVGPCLRFSLYRWAIAHDLEYRSGELTLVRDEKAKNATAERERDGILKRIEAEDERQIVARLEQQAKIWQELILGTRTPESYLSRDDRTEIAWESAGLYALIVLGALLALTIVGGGIVVLFGSLLGTVLEALARALTPGRLQPESLKDTVSILAGIVPWVTGAIVMFATVVRDGWGRARGLWARIYGDRETQRIKDKTWISVELASPEYQREYWYKTD